MITTNSTLTTPRLAIFLIALAMVSCDSFSDDEISPQNQLTFGEKRFYTVSGSAIIIDAASFIEESFVDATLVISTPPKKGAISKLDKILLKYRPKADFLAGIDKFAISVFVGGQERHTETVSVIIKSAVAELPCGLYAIDDHVYAAAGFSPAISVLKNDGLCGSDTSALEVSMYSAPTHGTASVTGNVITYTRGPNFADTDEFIYALSAWSGDSISYGTIKIKGCTLMGVADTIKVGKTRPSINILRNDGICGTSKTGLIVSISSRPQFGTASLVGDSVIVYIPGPEFRGRDQLIYQLATESGGSITDAEVQIIEDWNIESINLPGDVSKMFFLDETTGFVAGNGIYKTLDGGGTWTELDVPTDGEITDLQFLNKQLGYATYSKWNGGLLKTTDGGESWDLITFNTGARSVFFTSASTGYVSVFGDMLHPHQAILYKTTDGGEHWKEVFSRASTEPYGVEFANNDIGYLWGPDAIFITKNAGLSWSSLSSGGYMSSLAVTGNFAFSCVSGNRAVIEPSRIEKSTHGGNWQPEMYLQHKSLRVDFSPSENLGITVGLSNPSYFDFQGCQTYTITITRTIDQGETWTLDTGKKPLEYPNALSVPSDRLAYILCGQELIKYSYR